ncbi:hypothetical protein WKT02_09765 [Erysipelotrichaceae bacterium HCN-30851]
MNKKELNKIKDEIAYRNVMTKKLGRSTKTFFLFFLLFAALAFWGFMGVRDNFLSVSDSTRNIIKWVSLVLAIPTGILSIMFYLSFRNSKKYTLGLIDQVQGRKVKK